MEQLSKVLRHRQDVTRVHLFSHGSPRYL
ncbi:hypothetical protein [Gloeothece verrucosa]